jgi:XTP/dITP diphosphohydrolase
MMESKSTARRRLLLATSNRGKAREFDEMLGEAWEIFTLADLPPEEEVAETGRTFLENARLKALAGAKRFEGWVVADDSGLEVDVLGGRPGIHSARYAGVPRDDARNNEKLLEALRGQPMERRGAQFRCVLVVAEGSRVLFECEGVCRGTIATAASGSGGFGYDPLFIPEGESRSFAELPSALKHTMSHRSRAVARLVAWLNGGGGGGA